MSVERWAEDVPAPDPMPAVACLFCHPELFEASLARVPRMALCPEHAEVGKMMFDYAGQEQARRN